MQSEINPVHEFVQEARKLFYMRRTKFRKTTRLPLVEGSWGAWSRLGAGHYGEAWEHEDYPDLVVKISGPASWGELYKVGAGCFSEDFNGNPKDDIWPEYARTCMRNPHENLPRVHYLESVGRLTWGVLQRYESSWGDESSSNLIRHFKAAMRGERMAEYWMLPILDVARMQDCTLDLHSGNIMRCPDTGNIIITDPFSTIGTKAGGMLLGNTWGGARDYDEDEYDESTTTDLTTDEGDEEC